jgi:hypothetical protein
MALIDAVSSENLAAKTESRLSKLAAANKSEPSAKTIPIHQFSFPGIHRQRSKILPIASARAASGRVKLLRWWRECHTASDPSGR